MDPYGNVVVYDRLVYGVPIKCSTYYGGITCHSMAPCTTFYTTYENTLKSYYYTTPTQSHLISWKI